MKIAITFSAFDLLHAGHIKMLEEAKRQCDYLICGLQPIQLWIGQKKTSQPKLWWKDTSN
jgi:cytidyltransferase-like protein